ncbi:hypothetical protein PsYK624_016000 [Phanerochaete sordida]|uniref:Uncharacterized protein n=1 Tax=Phanerochaete sordida TaxID=48140 RepID=A0A9P3FZL2_9APHY|nr:hypothetical protein PsYK624_016000 [Phanerochaete sordida]
MSSRRKFQDGPHIIERGEELRSGGPRKVSSWTGRTMLSCACWWVPPTTAQWYQPPPAKSQWPFTSHGLLVTVADIICKGSALFATITNFQALSSTAAEVFLFFWRLRKNISDALQIGVVHTEPA